METSFDELRKKETINLSDGKRLGKPTDVVFTFPEGKVQGIVVPGSRGFCFGKARLFIELGNIKKIGVDAILVELKSAPPKPKKKDRWDDCCPPPPPQPRDRRDYGEYE